jgi:hypothetical protein
MSDVPAFDIVIEGETLHFNGKIKAREAMDIESVSGMSFEQWGTALQAGSISALVGLIYMLKKRVNPTIKFSDVDFDLTDLEVPNVAGELPPPEVPTEAEETA